LATGKFSKYLMPSKSYCLKWNDSWFTNNNNLVYKSLKRKKASTQGRKLFVIFYFQIA
jgi:hypothetical protein